MKIIVASNNKGKIKEFKKILEPIGYEVFSQTEEGINIEVVENGTSYKENSFLKANAVYEISKTAVIADDSGLSIDFFNRRSGALFCKI